MPSKPHADSMPVPAIVLAAGASTRLGQPKQLLRLPAFGGETLLDHAVELGAGFRCGANFRDPRRACGTKFISSVNCWTASWCATRHGRKAWRVPCGWGFRPCSKMLRLRLARWFWCAINRDYRRNICAACSMRTERMESRIAASRYAGRTGCAGNFSSRIVSGAAGAAGRPGRARVAAANWRGRSCD